MVHSNFSISRYIQLIKEKLSWSRRKKPCDWSKNGKIFVSVNKTCTSWHCMTRFCCQTCQWPVAAGTEIGITEILMPSKTYLLWLKALFETETTLTKSKSCLQSAFTKELPNWDFCCCESGLWSRSPSNFGWLVPEPEIWVPVLQI